MSLRPRARCHRRSIQKEAIPRPNMRTRNAIAPTTIRPTRPLRRRWDGGRGISDSGRIASEATRQRERVRIDIQDVRGFTTPVGKRSPKAAVPAGVLSLRSAQGQSLPPATHFTPMSATITAELFRRQRSLRQTAPTRRVHLSLLGMPLLPT